MDFSPDPLYRPQRYRPRFRNPVNALRPRRFESLTLNQREPTHPGCHSACNIWKPINSQIDTKFRLKLVEGGANGSFMIFFRTGPAIGCRNPKTRPPHPGDRGEGVRRNTLYKPEAKPPSIGSKAAACRHAQGELRLEPYVESCGRHDASLEVEVQTTSLTPIPNSRVGFRS
jgi:hypothetical protein